MNRYEEMRWVLVDQIVDLAVSTQLYVDTINQPGFSKENVKHSAMIRMALSYTVLNLAKLWECLDHYGKEINLLPEPLRTNCISLRSKLESMKVFQFRSKYIAHLIDKDTSKPLSLRDGQKYLSNIAGNNLDDLSVFFDWVCPPKGHSLDNTVVGTVTDLRDYCNELCSSDNRI
ncbi:TPA: hypothetical protein ACGF4R_003468 [Vibrio cholerae]